MGYSQTWDSVTAPAIPADWNASSFVTATGPSGSISGGNALRIDTTLSQAPAVYGSTDSSGGDVTVSATFRFVGTDTNNRWLLCARGNSDLTNCYAVNLSFEGGLGPVALQKLVSASATTLDGTTSNPLTTGVWYQAFLNIKGSSITVQVRRLTDGLWCNHAGVWSSTMADALTATSTTYSGSGYVGLISKQSTLGDSFADDFRLDPYNYHYFATGGVKVGNATVTPLVKHNVTASGGVKDGGTATPVHILRPNISGLNQGVLIGGSVSLGGQTFRPIPSGGVLVGGAATSSWIAAGAQGGGVLAGGAATNGVVLTPTTNGQGVKLAGTATPTVRYRPTTNGQGVKLAGIATPSGSINFVPSGGIFVGISEYVITIPAGTVTEDLTNFHLLVKAAVKPGPKQRFVFSDQQGNTLPSDTVTYDPSRGLLLANVLTPVASGSATRISLHCE